MRSLFTRLVPRLKLTKSKPDLGLANPGFTLIELLVVVIIGSIIITSLLALVNELLKSSQRETAKSETQRDMQMALDYIAADLREAAYVYDASCHEYTTTSCPPYANYVPSSLHTLNSSGTYTPINNKNSIAVLGFWKVDPIEPSDMAPVEALNCATTYSAAADAALRLECQQVQRQKRAYTLVVYAQEWDTVTNPTTPWKGKSRIVRYELKKYIAANLRSANNATRFQRRAGYVDPSAITNSGIFRTWPIFPSDTASARVDCQANQTSVSCTPGVVVSSTGTTNRAGTTVDDSKQVLTDFVDVALPPTGGAARPIPNPVCPSNQYLVSPQKTGLAASTAVPATQNVAAQMASTSFFVCVRGSLVINPTTGAPTTALDQPSLGEVQDIMVFLRGNAYGRARFLQDSYLPTLQTTITLRGIIDKSPGK
jgi:prepilin-type N-terminal cleavage/methylation domain-containing protein